MKKHLSMSLMLSSNQYHARLMDIRRQFESRRSDDYLSGLVEELAMSKKKAASSTSALWLPRAMSTRVVTCLTKR